MTHTRKSFYNKDLLRFSFLDVLNILQLIIVLYVCTPYMYSLELHMLIILTVILGAILCHLANVLYLTISCVSKDSLAVD